MLHPACVKGGVHNWSSWFYQPSRADGTKIQVLPDDTMTEMPVYRYRRDCQNMGCDAIECSEGLEAIGEHRLFDTHVTDDAIATATKKAD